MRSDNFNEEAMERKIKKNLEAGLNMIDIKIALREELKEVLKSIQIKEARATELTDQLDYMKKKHG